MTLHDVKDLFPSEALEIVVDNARQFTAGTMVRLRLIANTTTVYIEPIESSSESASGIALSNIEAHFATEHFANRWLRIQDTRYYAQVTPIENDRVTVFVIYSVPEKDLSGDFELAITDKQTTDKSEKSLRSADFVRHHILSDYILKIGKDQFIVVARHPFANNSSFQLSNGKYTYSVKECSRRELGFVENTQPYSGDSGEEAENHKDPSDMIWAINSGERPFVNQSEYTIELWKCNLKLADETTVEKQRMATKAFLESGLDKYLDAWKQYTDKEYELVKKIRDRAGKLEYRDATFLEGNRYRITIINSQMLADFQSCLESLGNDSSIEIDAIIINRKEKKIETTESARIISVETGNNLIIQMRKGTPATNGYIQVSIIMSQEQYKRRTAALERIITQHSAKEDLAMLIGGKKFVTSVLRQTKPKMAPLSDLVLKCFGGHTPTDAQRRAISVALNTPDFAIIQGPPGTGKTTVINGIMQALVEHEKDPELSYGKNLLTAYQRNATEHLAEKMRIFGLPAPVYMGERSNDNSEEDDWKAKDSSMSVWIQEKRVEINKHNPEISNLQARDRLSDRLHLLKTHFDPETATLGQIQSFLETLLEAIMECERSEEESYKQQFSLLQTKSLDDSLKSGELLSISAPLNFKAQVEIATTLLQEVDSKIDVNLHKMDRYYAGRLAATEAAMSDNGKESSLHILKRFLGNRHTPEVIRIAESLRSLYETEPVSYSKIQSRKDILIYSLTKSAWNSHDYEFNKKVSALLDGLLTYIEKSNGTDEQRVLADFYSAFDTDNEGILREWLSDFMTTIAATHQRAVSKPVKTHKHLEKITAQSEEPEVEFDNVLIDEAARSCPPDLLIPLSCAHDRMILVGDQKQLPQFISDEVYDKIDGYSKSELDDLVKITMFERLIQQVKKLEECDHIPRFVLLEEQYRMPKTLGDIISKHFYDGLIKSPLGNDANHTSDLAYIQGKHLVWLDVLGGRQSLTEEHSLVRQSEVSAIIRMLKAMIQKSPNSQDYSYAIITFYSAQRNRLFQAIKNDEFLSNWNRSHRKIMVGTVDAFQGMEADVVFLSLVRSLPKYDKGRNLYGFTANANRQCVALSRAKRCLIIVGDDSMVSGDRAEAAKQAMPAIEEIYQLCRKEDVSDACIFKDREFADSSV